MCGSELGLMKYRFCVVKLMCDVSSCWYLVCVCGVVLIGCVLIVMISCLVLVLGLGRLNVM